VMRRRRPRDPQAPLFSPALIFWSLLQGTLVLLLVAAIYVGALRRGMPESEVRALAFVSLVMANLGLILVNRSFSASIIAAVRRPNAVFWRVMAAAFSLLAVTLYVPPMRELFHFGTLHLDDLSVSLVAGVALLTALELLKLMVAPLAERNRVPNSARRR
jgi:Ca2+-transporting ATPase